MIKVIERRLRIQDCRGALATFSQFLASRDEIDEGGSNGLVEFFKAHPDLVLLMGSLMMPALSPAAYRPEFSILGEFRADFAVTNKERSKFVFIEFEPAKRDSVFSPKADTAGNTSYEWSPRFEHGFSQVVDWHHRMDDLATTGRFIEHFGSSKVDFEGLLVVGREKFVRQIGCEKRFAWRRDRTVINSRPLRCWTFDMLLEQMQGRLESMEAAISAEPA